jgi:hypothetical protein
MLKQYRDIVAGEFFIVAGDLAAGCGDRSVAQFLSVKRLDVPLVYSSFELGTELTATIHPVLEKLSDLTGYKPLVAFERASAGWSEMERLAGLNRLGKYEVYQSKQTGVVAPEQTNKLGWDTNSATRPQMLAGLKEAIDKQLIVLYDKQTIDELFSFVLVQTSNSVKAQAERNAHDDYVMSLAIAWAIYQQTHDYEKYRIKPLGFEYAEPYKPHYKY